MPRTYSRSAYPGNGSSCLITETRWCCSLRWRPGLARPGEAGGDERGEDLGGLSGVLERDLVADAVDDPDVGTPVRVGDLLVDRGRAERVIAAGDEQEREAGIDGPGIGGGGQRLVVA